MGSVHWMRLPGFALNAKILVTCVVWSAAAVAFTLRLRGALLAQRFAWTCLGLFVAAMLSLLAVESSRPPAPDASSPHGVEKQR